MAVNRLYTSNMANKTDDTLMEKIRAMFKESGQSLHALGLAMGYDAETARQSAFQFMKSCDPRISMLRKFAKAMDIPLSDLLDEKKSRSK